MDAHTKSAIEEHLHTAEQKRWHASCKTGADRDRQLEYGHQALDRADVLLGITSSGDIQARIATIRNDPFME